MSVSCEAVRRALEESAGTKGPELESHLQVCPACGAQASLLQLLAELAPGQANAEEVARLMERLPTPAWQLRRVATWLPLAAGGLLMVAGVSLVGGVPADSAVALLPSLTDRVVALIVSGGLDAVAALRGSADALRVLIAAGGSGAIMWLLLTAFGGGLAVRALVRRPSGSNR